MILEDPKCHHMSHCQLDVHWRPYFANCCYCKVPFQYFVRMESLEMDVEFIGRLANVQFQKREKNVVVGNRIKEKTTKYFSELDNQTIQNLLNLYKVDFEMFNYSF